MLGFGKKKQVVVKSAVNTQRRADGYRICDVEIITKFQQQYEGKYPDAVRAGLLAARDQAFVVNEVNLNRFINNEAWFNMGGQYD